MPSIEHVALRTQDLLKRTVLAFTSGVSGIILIAISVLVTADVIMRYVFLDPITGAQEVVQLMMPFLTIFAFAFALSVGAHVRMSLVTSHLPRRVQAVNEIVVHIIGLAICGLFAYGSWMYFWESFAIREIMQAQVRLPWWVGKGGMFLGMALFAAQFALMLFLLSSRLRASKRT